MGSRHTIVLFQPYANRSSRTYMEFDSVYQSMDGICGLFEKRLKDCNPTIRNLTYDVSELYDFIDNIPDLSALVFDPSLNAYIPYGRAWIKLRIYQHLKKYASEGFCDRRGFGGATMALQQGGRHTIVLYQPSINRGSRTFLDYDSVTQAMDGICGLFEKKLKEMNPSVRNITYEVADLYRFIDELPDMSALVYEAEINAYVPYDRQWIKLRAFQHLRKLAGSA